MPNILYDELFGRHVGKPTPFLELVDGSSITHGDFLLRACQVANLLAKLGLKPGDRVAVQIEKSADALSLYAACVQAGLIFLPLNTAYTASELEYFVQDSGAKLIVCDASKEDRIKAFASPMGVIVETLDENGKGSFAAKADEMQAVFETVDRDSEDLAAFLYTSGTTGRSKGAMLTQLNLLSNCKTLAQEWRFSDQDKLLHALPIFHTHGLFVACNVTLIAGGSMFFLPKFDVDKIVELLPDVTTMMGVPTFYTRLLKDQRFTKDLTKHMRLFVSGSAPLLAETHIEFEERTGHRILERYGMTETNMNTSNPYDGERRAGTVGFPLPGIELKITDPESGEKLKDGEIGLIEVRGDNVFKGYWKMPEKTKDELRDDGFFITGDLGRLDEDGYLQIIGRDKDLIISGGYNIYPKEIEVLLDEQSGVEESAVVGVPHPDFGETVLAILVGKKSAEPDIESIKSKVNEKLARFKHPRKIIILDELPRNTMGKVQKNILRDTYKDLFV